MVTDRHPHALPPPPKEALAEVLELETVLVEWLAGDGSDRCYYRVSSSDHAQTYVLMQLSGSDAAALKENGYDWITLGVILADAGVRVPGLRAAMPDYAALIIEDYGDTMLETVLLDILAKEKQNTTLDRYFDQCFETIARMLAISGNTDTVWQSRSFDQEKLAWELNFFMSQYLEPLHGEKISQEHRALFKNEVTALCDHLGREAKYFVHRDFHCRNIMVSGDDLAIIDFQDARLGPITYDLVSIIFDNYIPLPITERLRLLEIGKRTICQHLGQDLQFEMDSQVRLVALQRQLKAIGTYGYLTLNKKRGNYLRYVAPALDTLQADTVFDDRWPFLSRELPELLRTWTQDNEQR